MPMRLYIIVLLSACLSTSVCIAADEPKGPQSPAAVAAMRERDKAVKEAEDAYHQAEIKAERAMITKLKVALVTATKAGNLSEANAIDGQIKAAMARVDGVGGKSLVYAVKAENPWQRVATLNAGEYVITAQGKWKWGMHAGEECGPNGSDDKSVGGKSVGALLVKFGEKQALTGERTTIHVESDGTPISFQMNDDTFEDNQGSLTVSITKVAH
jgi:hypothetical protein